jgi:4-hydroxy-3-methylbut-2-enyl diphosphate reductase
VPLDSEIRPEADIEIMRISKIGTLVWFWQHFVGSQAYPRPGNGCAPYPERGKWLCCSATNTRPPGGTGRGRPGLLWSGSGTDMRVILAQPRGFCAGVVRAIDIVEKALDKYGEPVYVRHEIVHNKHVVDKLKNKGARFVEELDEVPEGAVTVFSAHGVPQSVVKTAQDRGLPVLDATCPLVSKVHNQGKRYVAHGRTLILIGHAGHPEVEGTMGQVGAPVTLVQNEADVAALEIPPATPVAYITQTTLSIDDTKGIIVALKKRFSDIVGPETSDICYATQNRQTSVRELAKIADVILVVGAANSSNSNRLREIGIEEGVPSYLINDGGELKPEWVRGKKVVGLTAGASAPEELVRHVIDALGRIENVDVEQMDGKKEHIEFRLPAELRV